MKSFSAEVMVLRFMGTAACGMVVYPYPGRSRAWTEKERERGAMT
jgi:hypothetical protein